MIGILHKLKYSFPQRILRLIYNSLIRPHLIDGLYLWGFNPKRLTILQKRAENPNPSTLSISLNSFVQIFKTS